MRKVSDRHKQWLIKELPVLERDGVLVPEQTAAIKSYYDTHTKSGLHWAVIAFSILGSLLISSGIILLFAHNWDEMSRPVRAVLSFVPLAIGLAVSFTALARKGGMALRESAGIFHSLAVGATISLIGQTYHLPSDAPAFLLTWSLLIMPLMFLLRSTGSYLIYLALVSCWSGVAQETYGQASAFWLLIVPPIIRLTQTTRSNLYSQESAIGFAGIIIALSISVGIALEHAIPGLWIITYSALLSGIGLLGIHLYGDRLGPNNVPKALGLLGVVVLTYILTWEEVWDEAHLGRHLTQQASRSWNTWLDIGIAALCVGGWIHVAVKSVRWNTAESITLAAFPVVTGLCYALGSLTSLGAVVYALVFNLFMLCFGIMYVVLGCRNGRLRQLNGGMAVLSLLLVTRFFDSGFGYMARGVVFIVLGAVFLTVNLIMVRNRKRKEVTA